MLALCTAHDLLECLDVRGSRIAEAEPPSLDTYGGLASGVVVRGTAGTLSLRWLMKQQVQTAKDARSETAWAMIRSLSPPHACNPITTSTSPSTPLCESSEASPTTKRRLVSAADEALRRATRAPLWQWPAH